MRRGHFASACAFALCLAACGGSNASSPAPSSASGAAPSASASPAAPGPTLARGDRAPDFNLQGSDGKMHALADSVGKQAVVIAWFPEAFTEG
jgi:hypothetical protein